MRNIRQNLFFAFVYNTLGVPVAAGVLYPALGLLLSPMIASAAMTFNSVSVLGTRFGCTGGTLMGMRSSTVLLLVTLIGPSLVSVVCDVTCVHHEHHAVQPAATQSCHEQRGVHHGLAVSSGPAAFCHQQAETFTATAADVRIQKAAPVAVHAPSVLAVYHPQLLLVARTTSFNPAGIVLQTTQLRI